MRNPLLPFLVLLCSGCQVVPHTELQSSDTTGVTRTYSRYFQNDRPLVANTLIVDAIVTFGKERLPKDYRPAKVISYGDGQIEAVLELYFRNQTDQTAEIRIERFICEKFTDRLAPMVFTIAPKQFTQSIPVVVEASNYRNFPYKYSMEISVNGMRHTVSGNISRLTIDELKDRRKNGGYKSREATVSAGMSAAEQPPRQP